MSEKRVAIAERNLRAALDAAQADFTATVQFTTDGYIVILKGGWVTWSARVPLEVLEDQDSPKTEELVEEARRELDRQEAEACGRCWRRADTECRMKTLPGTSFRVG